MAPLLRSTNGYVEFLTVPDYIPGILYELVRIEQISTETFLFLNVNVIALQLKGIF